MSDYEEIFINPEYALKRPNEVILKFAFNEDAALGLIISYQDIGDEVIFTGISLMEHKMWLCKSPLVIKGTPAPESLQNISRVVSSLGEDSAPSIQGAMYEQTPNGISRRPLSASSLSDLFRILEGLRSPPLGRENQSNDYFGSPDFTPSEGVKFDFGMDAFLEAFDSTGEESESDDESDDDNNNNNSDPDGLG